MGHKVHPTIHRTQVVWSWDSKWFGRGKQYAEFSRHDALVRRYLGKIFKDAHIDSISIERGPKQMVITIMAAKPGFIIGRGGKGLDDARKYIERVILQMKSKVRMNILELRSPALSAHVVGQSMAEEIERRMPFRRVMKQTIERVMKAGAQGVKVAMSGRLNGAEIARREKMAVGKIPLITLRSDVDFAIVEAHTTYGKIGIKVWIYRGEIFGRKDKFTDGRAPESEGTKTGRRPVRSGQPQAQRAT